MKLTSIIMHKIMNNYCRRSKLVIRYSLIDISNYYITNSHAKTQGTLRKIKQKIIGVG